MYVCKYKRVLEVFPVQFMSVSIQSLSLYYRGYGESDKPPEVTDYKMSKLTKDIAELVSIDCNTFDKPAMTYMYMYWWWWLTLIS